MTGQRRLCLVTPGWPGQNTPNGIATSVYHLAMGLHEIGQTPVILAEQIDDTPPPDIPVLALPALPWRLWDRLRAKFGDAEASHRHIARTFATALRDITKTHAVDAVIIEETNGWAGMVAPQIPIPVFITLHGPWVLHKTLQSRNSPEADRQREAREARAFARAAGLISPSHNVLEAVQKTAPLSQVPQIVLPNTIRPETGRPASVATAPPDVLFIGRFDTHKGGDTVLTALDHLTRTTPEARLTFCGPDRGVRREDGSILHMDTALTALPDPARNSLDYKGAVDRKTVAGMRETHAIALIASRYENLNYTLLEAMAAGQAIVCTDVGGPAEILTSEKNALLVPPDDPQAMAGALKRLLEDADLRTRLGAAAQASIEADFNPATIARRTAEFVQDACRPTPGK